MGRSAKVTPIVTEEQEVHLPDVKSRKQMLKNALSEIQNQGYLSHVNLVIAKAQKGLKVGVADGRGGQMMKDKKDHLKDLQETIDNSYRAALAIEAEIGKLPEEPEPVEDDTDVGPDPDIRPKEGD